MVVLSEESAGKSVPEESAKVAATSPPDGTKGNTKDDERSLAAVTPTTNNLKSPPEATKGTDKDKGGVAAVTPPAKKNTNNLVAKIELLKTQSVSRPVVWSFSLLCFFCCVTDMFAHFVQKIARDIAATKRKCDHHWRAYKSEYAGYVHYTKSLDKMMQRRGEVNITLGVIERSLTRQLATAS